MLGGVTTVALSSFSVTLTASQAKCSIIRLTGTTTVNGLTIVLPGIYKGWTIDNRLLNAPSSFFVTMTSSAGTSIIGLPPWAQDVYYDGTSVGYRNLGRVGEYWDYAGTTVPGWASNGTKPPYLLCDGTAFSSATYPLLTHLLGGTTLPDARGRFRATINSGTGRITSAVSGVDGNTALAVGSSQSKTLITANLPAYTPSGSVTGTALTTTNLLSNGSPQTAINFGGSGVGAFGWQNVAVDGQVTSNLSATFNGTAQGGTSTAFGILPPTYMGGITMIRAG